MSDEPDRIMLRPEVSEITGLTESSLYRAINNREFPAPLLLSARRVGWRASEVQEWIENRPRREVKEGAK